MVAANKNLLKEVRRLAIKDELLAMKLRGRLVVTGHGSSEKVVAVEGMDDEAIRAAFSSDNRENQAKSDGSVTRE